MEHRHRWKLWNSAKQIYNNELGYTELKDEYICKCGAKEYRPYQERSAKGKRSEI